MVGRKVGIEVDGREKENEGLRIEGRLDGVVKRRMCGRVRN